MLSQEQYVVHFPKTLDIYAGAPLLSAGITVWSSMKVIVSLRLVSEASHPYTDTPIMLSDRSMIELTFLGILLNDL